MLTEKKLFFEKETPENLWSDIISTLAEKSIQFQFCVQVERKQNQLKSITGDS